MITNSNSYIAVPPGETIKEILDDRGLTQKSFAAMMCYSEKHINRLLNGRVELTPETAFRLEEVLGVEAKFWNSLESDYRETLAKAKAENEMDADITEMRKYPYREMIKRGWIDEGKTNEEQVFLLRKFFNVSSLQIVHDNSICHVAFRKLSKTERSDYATLTWLQQVKRLSREIEVAPINMQKLIKSISSIRKLTLLPFEEGILKLKKIFSECGIALILLAHIENSFLQGATMRDGKKIVIGMTLRRKDLDVFWFSLFHEISHALQCDMDLTEGTTDTEESRANQFAADTLIPINEISTFESTSDMTAESIKAFAERVKIDKGIVVGRLQNDKIIRFDQFNDLKSQYSLV